MTKHSLRLILKISYFRISASELVLRNRIRFVARIRVECRFDNSPSGYSIEYEMFLLVALLATVSRFLLRWPFWLKYNTPT